MRDEGILELPSIALKFNVEYLVYIRLAARNVEPKYIGGFRKTIDDV